MYFYTENIGPVLFARNTKIGIPKKMLNGTYYLVKLGRTSPR